MFQALLNDYHDRMLGCTALAALDVSSGIILCTSEQTEFPQTVLDRIAHRAQRELGHKANSMLEALSSNAQQSVASYPDAEGFAVAVRSLESKDDAVVCRFEHAPLRTEVMALAASLFPETPMDGGHSS